jgi:RNA polymerase sigma-70 factor (ECF subfamily)
LRQKYRQEALLENAFHDLRGGENDDIPYERSDEIANVLEKLDGMPLPQRELLTLYYLDELSIDEVGQVLGIPAGTVKSRLYYARQSLKEAVMAKENLR